MTTLDELQMIVLRHLEMVTADRKEGILRPGTELLMRIPYEVADLLVEAAADDPLMQEKLIQSITASFVRGLRGMLNYAEEQVQMYEEAAQPAIAAA